MASTNSAWLSCFSVDSRTFVCFECGFELTLPPIYSSHLVHRTVAVICVSHIISQSFGFLRTVLLFPLIQSFSSFSLWIDSHNNFFIFPLRKGYQYGLFLVKFHFFSSILTNFFGHHLIVYLISFNFQSSKFSFIPSSIRKCENISSSTSNH